jgi:hypothetical protein
MPAVSSEPVSQFRGLRIVGMFLLDTLTAVIGAAILEASLFKITPTHSIAGVIRKEWILSILCAWFIGFFMFRTWRSETAKWAWALPTTWFVFGCLVALGSLHEHSALLGGSALGNFWVQLSGAECDSGLRAPGCRNFFLFTISFIRAVSYSTGALVSSRIYELRLVPADSDEVSNETSGAEDGPRA